MHIRDNNSSITAFIIKDYFYNLFPLITDAEFMEYGMQYLNLPVAHLFDLHASLVSLTRKH